MNTVQETALGAVDPSPSEFEQSVGCYYPSLLSSLPRRPSWFEEVNQSTGGVTVYHPVREIGRSYYSRVREFASSSGASIAVKSSILDGQECSQEDYDEEVFNAASEVVFTKEACACYGNANALSHAFFFRNPLKSEKIKYAKRIISPLAEGETVFDFIRRPTNPKTLIRAILSMLEALIRLHTQGHIIHGDIKMDNVMIAIQPDSIKATFIDYEHAYHITDEEVRMTTDSSVKYWAPERITSDRDHTRSSEFKLKPHTSQDVFSFGYMLKVIVEMHPHVASFSVSIRQFIRDSLNVNPHKRPRLSLFYNDLQQEYNALDRAVLTRNVSIETAHTNNGHVESEVSFTDVDEDNVSRMEV